MRNLIAQRVVCGYDTALSNRLLDTMLVHGGPQGPDHGRGEQHPLLWGSRSSMAALTRSGARKASEIVMLTFRVLHPLRLAMLSAFDVGLAPNGAV